MRRLRWKDIKQTKAVLEVKKWGIGQFCVIMTWCRPLDNASAVTGMILIMLVNSVVESVYCLMHSLRPDTHDGPVTVRNARAPRHCEGFLCSRVRWRRIHNLSSPNSKVSLNPAETLRIYETKFVERIITPQKQTMLKEHMENAAMLLTCSTM